MRPSRPYLLALVALVGTLATRELVEARSEHGDAPEVRVLSCGGDIVFATRRSAPVQGISIQIGPTRPAAKADQCRPIRQPAQLWALGRRIPLDRARRHDLQLIPGIGPTLATRILAERRRSAFASLADLRRVRGIGPKRLARLRRYLSLGGDRID